MNHEAIRSRARRNSGTTDRASIFLGRAQPKFNAPVEHANKPTPVC